MSFEQDSVRLTADNLKALAHPLRVQILGLLRTYGPATATGLAARLGLTSGALSYHLRQLRDGGLVSMRRSAADGRDTYYALDLALCGELLTSVGVSLHPGLKPPPRPRAGRARGSVLGRVLFLCTEAASYMTGQELVIDGGITAGGRPQPRQQ